MSFSEKKAPLKTATDVPTCEPPPSRVAIPRCSHCAMAQGGNQRGRFSKWKSSLLLINVD